MRAFPEAAVWIANQHSSMLVGTRRWTPHLGGLLWGGEDGVEAEHPEQEHSPKRDRNQKSVPTGLKNDVVYDRLMVQYEKLLTLSIRLSVKG